MAQWIKVLPARTDKFSVIPWNPHDGRKAQASSKQQVLVTFLLFLAYSSSLSPPGLVALLKMVDQVWTMALISGGSRAVLVLKELFFVLYCWEAV